MKMNKLTLCLLSGLIGATTLWGCNADKAVEKQPAPVAKSAQEQAQKMVVYQVFTRLFGNTNTTNKPWGTLEENGVGKFNDFTDKALAGIKELGTTHIWYTGVPHHATITDYTQYGISNDDPDVVKGRAGSPYAVKDYYNVNPDMAVDPAKRLEEFEALIKRTHKHGMKVVIDIVPNHVARGYKSLSAPEGVVDFGAQDDTHSEYRRDNNFYYIPGQDFVVPQGDNYQPLGGEEHPAADSQFAESPAKWTGNGARKPQPHLNDWYETVKLNYGVKPDGSKDYVELPDAYAYKTHEEHLAFWEQQSLPNSWLKMRDIAIYWINKGVDGFRFDVAAMVPYDFWSFMNSSIKAVNPDAFLLAEIYEPHKYRDYIYKGQMDYLYDKVDMYDRLREIMNGKTSTDVLVDVQQTYADIDANLLRFLENHDEQRIASPEFAGNADKGKPAMVVSTTIGRGPIMIYFGQSVGEDGSEELGFGDPSRTTIFDYAGVPAHQRWMNDGQFDGGQLKPEEKSLRDFYERLLSFSAKSPAMMGDYADLHKVNRSASPDYTEQLFSYVRYTNDEKLFILTNFSEDQSKPLELIVPATVIEQLKLKDGRYTLVDQIYGQEKVMLEVFQGRGRIPTQLDGLESFIFKVMP